MAHRALIAAAFLCVGPAHAFYGSLTPPGGWMANVPGQRATFAVSPTDVPGASQVVRTTATATVSGRAVAVPATLRYAANAGRFASRAIFLNPALALGVAAAGWLAEECLSHADGKWSFTCGPNANAPVSDGYEYAYRPDLQYHPQAILACRQWVDQLVSDSVYFSAPTTFVSGDVTYCRTVQIWKTGPNAGRENGAEALALTRRTKPDCPAGWFITPAGCTRTAPPVEVTQPQFEDIFDSKPMPIGLPREVKVPLPVEDPVINPAPDAPTVPRKVVVPVGDPVLQPTDPPTQKQPVVEIKPSPTVADPWRVDYKPSDVVSEPGTPPLKDPGPLPDPAAPPPTIPKDPAETDGLCDKYPDIVACQKLTMPESVKLPTFEQPFDFQPEGGFSNSATCPAPITVHAAGRTLSFSWKPFCDSLAMVRNLILAMAWLSAAFIFIGHKS